MKKPITVLCAVVTAAALLFLVACGTATLEKPDDPLPLNIQGHKNTLANNVPLPNGSLYPYPSSYPVEDDNEAKLAKRAKQLLEHEAYRDPSFDDSSNPAWSCNESSSISDGLLNLELDGFPWSTVPVGFCTQELNTPEAGIYYLTCKGSVDTLNGYSVFGLAYTDNEGKTTEVYEPLSYIHKQKRITVDLPHNIQTLNIKVYTEAIADYDYCYLSNKPQPKLVPETIYKPVKPLEILVPLYIDPDIVISNPDTNTEVIALESWKDLIKQAKKNQKVPMTVILNPSNSKPSVENPEDAPALCELGGFETYVEGMTKRSNIFKKDNILYSLQKTGVDTIGYVPTGFGKADAQTIKATIDNFVEKCPYLDGIFFDEVEIMNLDQLALYTDVCNYARSKIPYGKYVLNSGVNISLALDNQNCNIALIYEQTPEQWQEYEAYGFDGSVGQPATATLIHSNMTNRELRHNVDLAYSRKFDYIYVTDLSLNEAGLENNPWFKLGSNWSKLINYIDQKNRSLRH